NPDPGPYDYFGSSIACAGGKIFIGARNDTVPGADGSPQGYAGRVFVYGRDGALEDALVDPAPSQYDFFASYILPVGDRVLVGSMAWLKYGAVQVFDV